MNQVISKIYNEVYRSNRCLCVYSEILHILEVREGAFEDVYFWIDVFGDGLEHKHIG